MNNKQNESDNESILLELMQDISCLDRLRPWTDEVNIFRVLKISRTEIRHSNMLAWLLDPNENHGLGTAFLEAFIIDLSKPHSYDDGQDEDAILAPQAALDILTSDLTVTIVLREWNHIDVLLKLPQNYIIAIENKIDASEGKRNGKSQLDAYNTALENNYKESNKINLFLSPDAKKSSQPDTWKRYTYSDILSLLNDVYVRHENHLTNIARVLIKNYIEILNTEIMEDIKLKDLCNEIYNSHKQAFDLIYEYRENVTTQASSICFNKLKEMSNDLKLEDTEPKSTINFTTTGSNALRSQFKEYGVDCRYYYYFKPEGDFGVKGSLTVALDNKNNIQKEEFVRLVKKYSNIDRSKKTSLPAWITLWSENESFKEISDKEIGKWIGDSIYKLKKYEIEKNLLQ